MVHRVPTRQPRHVLLGGACALLFLLCLGFSIFFLLRAPNTDVMLLSCGAALLLLWPLSVLVGRIFGEIMIQVEHAGVVAAFHCFGIRMSRRGWLAAQILRFDWEQTADGLFALRLLLSRRDGGSSFLTVLHTDSPYALAAVWRDLELHYPGSGLRSELPTSVAPAGGGARRFSLLLLLGGAAGALCLWQPLSRPLMALALGQVVPAEVLAIDWGNAKSTGSPYHLQLLPRGAAEPVRSASSFYAHSNRVPRIGQRLPVLWAEGLSYCYLPGETLSFLAPIPVLAACLLAAWFGVWGLFISHRHLLPVRPLRRA